MPKIAMLEGYRGIPRSGRYGALMCGELDPLVAKIGVALSEARRVGVPTTDTRYAAAAEFHSKQSGWWSSQDFMMPGTCRNLVAEGQSLLAGVNRAVADKGGQLTASSVAPVEQDWGVNAILGNVKWIVLGVAGIAGLVYLGPMIKAATTAKKIKGRKGRR